jgi:hypothetical protein
VFLVLGDLAVDGTIGGIAELEGSNQDIIYFVVSTMGSSQDGVGSNQGASASSQIHVVQELSRLRLLTLDNVGVVVLTWIRKSVFVSKAEMMV